MDNEKKEFRYIQFPLCLLMETYGEDTVKALGIILEFGIMNYALKLSYEINDVAKQLLYSYSRKSNVLQKEILDVIENEDSSLITDDEYLFNSEGTYNPQEDAIRSVLDEFEADEKFKKNAVLNYQLHLAESHLCVKITSNDWVIKRFDTALAFQKKFEEKFGLDAMVSCKLEMLFNFIKYPKDIDLFRAHIGIKSMIGRRNFISSNKPAILSRMIGCKSKAAFEYYTANRYNKNKNLLPTVEKYSKRYHMDKLLLALAERKFNMFLSKEKVSVIYLSKYMEPEELVRLVKDTKQRQNIRQRIRDVAASL